MARRIIGALALDDGKVKRLSQHALDLLDDSWGQPVGEVIKDSNSRVRTFGTLAAASAGEDGS